MKKLGLIINPIAGLGGCVGLKGTDGVLEQALAKGAVPHAAEKAARALTLLLPLRNELQVATCSGPMGASVLHELGFCFQIDYQARCERTTATDTQTAAKALAKAGVEIIAFVGGDGTARDICRSIGENVPALGIPAGVKIHSPVYAQSPEKAGELLKLYLTGQTNYLQEAEVVDINEHDYRRDIINTQLFGYLRVPYERRFLQGGKAPSPISEQAAQQEIAQDIVDRLKPDTLYLVGPGSTTRTLMRQLGADNTLLGVDALLNGKTIAKDLNEVELLSILQSYPTKLIITPTGGQGFLLGRGNQQLSPSVLRIIGKANIIVIATKQKLASLKNQPLLVDTGDPETDKLFRGYIHVTVGWHETVIYPIA